MATTIYSLDNVKAQVILQSAFGIEVVDMKKHLINLKNFTNAGYFTKLGDYI